MINKNAKTIVFAAFFSVIISIIGANDAYADHVDYVDQIADTFSEHEKLHANVIEYKSHVEQSSNPHEVALLEKMITMKQNEMKQIFKEIKNLEKLNKKSYELDTETQKLFDNAIQKALELYNPSSNPDVLDIFPDKQHKKILILMDEKNLDFSSFETISTQQIEIETIPIEFVSTSFEPLSCYGREYECDPLRAGISVAAKDVNSLNTQGYKATRNSVVGFVITAHTADFDDGIEIVQAHNQNNNEVGEVDGICWGSGNCDSAFVELDDSERDITDDIFRTSSTVWDVCGKVAESQMEQGDVVWKSGAATGLTIGDIYSFSPSSDRITLDIYQAGGDSGSPIFEVTTSGCAKIYGMLTGTWAGNPFMYPQDDIEDDIDAKVSTS